MDTFIVDTLIIKIFNLDIKGIDIKLLFRKQVSIFPGKDLIINNIWFGLTILIE